MNRFSAIVSVLLLLGFGLSMAQDAVPVSGSTRLTPSPLPAAPGHLLAARLSFSTPSDEDDTSTKKKPHARKGDNDIVVAGGSYSLGPEDTTSGNVVLIGGTGDIKGKIAGDLVMIGSKATFSGIVDGDLVVIASNLQNESGATANGDLVSFASEMGNPDLLQVHGERTAVNTFSPVIPFFKEGFNNLAHLRPMSPFSVISWSMAILVLIVRLIIAWIFPKSFPATDLILRERPLPTFLIGLAIIPAVAVLSFLLLVTFVGIVALPFVALAVIILDLFGEASVSCWIGKRVVPHLADRNYAVYAWIAIGTVVLWVLYCIPVVGLVATCLSFVLGIGTTSIYLFERYRSTSPKPLEITTMKPEKDPAAYPSPPPLPLAAPSVANLSKARFFPRLAANLIDLVLLYVLLVSLHLTRGLIPAWIVYRFAMFSWRSATLGEIVLNLRVQKLDGTLLTGDYSGSLIRALASLISLVPLGLGFIWILFNQELDSWHDKISGSYVVQFNPNLHPSSTAPPGG